MAKLVVEVLDATDLMPKDGHGSASPFVEVEFDEQRQRTSTKPKDLNPSWNENLVFNIKNPRDLPNQTIEVFVYNDNKQGHHKNFLGRVRISGMSVPFSDHEAVVQRRGPPPPPPEKPVFVETRSDFAKSGAAPPAATDKDIGKDDLVGKVLFDIAEVPQREPPDSPLAPQWYRLVDKKGEKINQGEIMLAVWMGTQADEAFPEAWHSDAHSVSQQSLANTRSKVYFSPKLYYLRAHMIAAQDLVPSDKGRQPDTFVRVQLGHQMRVTRPSPMKHINPEWNEELMFVASEPFDEYIIISVEDRIGPGKDEVLGRIIIPVREVPHRSETAKLPDARWFALQKPSVAEEEGEKKKEVKFASRILLRLCIDSGYHVLDESTHFSSDLQPSSKHLRKPSIGLLEVGILSARNLLPMKGKDGRMTDAYCVAKYGNKWVRTRTLLDTLHPGGTSSTLGKCMILAP
ncbi:UNVERIFIED_CONTAM: FT-interacting protein 7 [Sesamum latifolium]|uniref:FT-interacting protein 7 n=1 Tax=Sesamum latifolium TaxID=2727402 RepID=A0AAW2VR80_9LAMI